jgi:hypothetical protein
MLLMEIRLCEQVGWMTPGLMVGEFTMDEHERGVLGRAFPDPCSLLGALNGVVTETGGRIDSGYLAGDGRRSRSSRGANRDCGSVWRCINGLQELYRMLRTFGLEAPAERVPRSASPNELTDRAVIEVPISWARVSPPPGGDGPLVEESMRLAWFTR